MDDVLFHFQTPFFTIFGMNICLFARTIFLLTTPIRKSTPQTHWNTKCCCAFFPVQNEHWLFVIYQCSKWAFIVDGSLLTSEFIFLSLCFSMFLYLFVVYVHSLRISLKWHGFVCIKIVTCVRESSFFHFCLLTSF